MIHTYKIQKVLFLYIFISSDAINVRFKYAGLILPKGEGTTPGILHVQYIVLNT